LTIGKMTVVRTRVALLCVLCYTCLDGVYFSLQYCGMEPKAEAVPLVEPHLFTSAPVPALVLGPSKSDHSPFTIRVEPILPFTLVRQLGCEWLVICISHCQSASVGWVHASSFKAASHG
jgi:hypothetical protein